MGIGRVATERVLAHQAWADMDVHMGTGFEQRQRRAVGVGQVENDDAVPLQLALAHDHVQ